MRRLALVVGSAAAAVAAAVVVFGGGAGAASTTVKISGADSFVPNGKVASTFHFTPGTISVHSGSTATWSNTTADPHTVTVVKPGQVPSNVNQVFNCKVCASQAPQASAGGPGLDVPGDSLFVKPHGTVSAAVTAKSGTTLHYICIFHPWMQGVINVT
jgi:plastocyanin